jgi:hypothetical protein
MSVAPAPPSERPFSAPPQQDNARRRLWAFFCMFVVPPLALAVAIPSGVVDGRQMWKDIFSPPAVVPAPEQGGTPETSAPESTGGGAAPTTTPELPSQDDPGTSAPQPPQAAEVMAHDLSMDSTESGLTVTSYVGRQSAVSAASPDVPFAWANAETAGTSSRCALTMIAVGQADGEAKLYAGLNDAGFQALEYEPDHTELSRLGVGHQQVITLPPNAAAGDTWVARPEMTIGDRRYVLAPYEVAVTARSGNDVTLTISGQSIGCSL